MRVGVTDTTALRKVNKTLTLELIREEGPLSRADLSRALGITRSTMSLIMQDLLAEGLVREAGLGSPHTGRKSVLYEFNPAAGFVLGVDIGGTNIKCQVADLSGTSLHQEHWETFPENTSKGFIRKLVAEIRSMLRRVPLRESRLKALGVATPGVVDPYRGVVLGASPNLPEWSDLRLGEFLARDFGVPVQVENDVNAALIGEHVFGIGRGYKHLVYLVLSTGIGGALMLNGEIYRGATFGAGEVGYWLLGPTQIHQDWKPKGAFECTCSATAIAAEGTRIVGRPVTTKEVFEAARGGNGAARSLVEETAEKIGLVVSNLAALLDVDIIILGGGLMFSSDLLLPTIRTVVERHAIRMPVIAASAMADEAGVKGAVQLALTVALPGARIHLGGNQR